MQIPNSSLKIGACITFVNAHIIQVLRKNPQFMAKIYDKNHGLMRIFRASCKVSALKKSVYYTGCMLITTACVK